MSRPPSRTHDRPSSRSNSRRSSNATGGFALQQQQPDPYSFCNSFWGDYGYDTLQTKTKQSSKMLEDLRSWYKERASIEEDYARRMTKLTKNPLFEIYPHNHHSTDLEVGGMKKALETVRDTTRQSAHSHLELAGTIRTALEKKVSEFINRREGLKKNPQAAIERLHKKKSELIELTEKSRKKYEADAIAVNGLSAQTHLVQGRDYDKVTAKLDRAQQNVQMDEREYRSHVKNLKETIAEWNMQWKGYCDLAQDLEEERIDFIRTSFWDYANGVSTICVVDDEQCEIIRKALERCDTTHDVTEFVRLSRTGSEIHVAPDYVNYARGEQTPYNRPPPIPANFVRSSIRNPRSVPSTTNIQDLAHAIRSGPSSPTESAPPPSSIRTSSKVAVKRGGAIADAVAANSFGSGDANPGLVPRASVSRSSMGASISRAASPAEAMAQVVGNGPNESLNSRQSTQTNNHHAPPALPSIPPEHFPAGHIASHSTNSKPYDSDASKQDPGVPPPPPASAKPANRYMPNYASKEPPHVSGGLPPPSNRPASRASTNGGIQPPSVPSENGQVDPLVAALEKLRSTPSLSSFRRSPAPNATPARARQLDGHDGRKSTLEQPSLNGQSNRASSPAASSRKLASDQPSSYDPYKRISSPAVSARRATLTEPQSNHSYQRSSTPSAQKTTSEHLSSYDPYKRSHSPAIMAATIKPPHDIRSNGASSPSVQAPGAYHRGAPSPAPSSSGQIPISNNGYQQQPSHRPLHNRPLSHAPPSSLEHVPNGTHQLNHQHSQSLSSMTMMTSPASYQGAGTSQLPFRQQAPPSHGGRPLSNQAPPPHHSQSGGYGAPRPPQHYGYAPPPSNQPPPSVPPAPTSSYQSQPSGGPQNQYSLPPSQSQTFNASQLQYYGGGGGPMGSASTAPNHNRTPSSNSLQNQAGAVQRTASIYGNPPGSHQTNYYQQNSQPQPSSQPPPSNQSKPPSPTGNYTESGEPILFYVRALYDYAATMSEEFSFQANDIIGITHTDPDGWWQGELMDEFRRSQSQSNGHGGNVLPSNFVEVLNQ